jgi:hypothetical protein
VRESFDAVREAKAEDDESARDDASKERRRDGD